MRDLPTKRKLFAAALLAGTCSWGAVPAMAQSAGDTQSNADAAVAPAEEGQSDEIVVTALRRSTALQETPISISAVSGDTLVRAGVRDIGSLNSPSLSFVDSGPSSRRVVIRGIQAAGEPTVGVYYDETPVTGALGAGNDAGSNTPELRLFDVERVEVLRGPQGTLYGAGSMGGTLRIIYNKPAFETEVAGDVTLSSTQGGGTNHIGNAMVNVPLVTDQLALRLTGFYSLDDGYIDNVALGIENVNRAKVYGGRAQLRFTPSPDLTLDLAAFINRSRTDASLWTAETGRYESDALTRQPRRDDFNLYNGTVNWDLGGANLTGTVSYSHLRRESGNDVTRFLATRRTPGSCASLFNANVTCDAARLAEFYAFVDEQLPSALYPAQTVKALTAELRLGSDGSGPLDWTIGGFYSRRRSMVNNRQAAGEPDTGILRPDLPLFVQRLIDDTLKQVAVFAELSWDITDRLNVTGGIRYFNYDRFVVGETPIGNILVRSQVLPPATYESSEDGTTLRFNASYKLTDDVMFYAEAAQGFRPGGLNQVFDLPPELTPYSSDRVWNYEIGVKSTLFDRALTLNLDVFRIDWTDIQITGTSPNGAFRFLTNAGSARVEGVEVEAFLRPARGLSIDATATYINARLTEDQRTATVVAPGLDGDRIPYVPRFAGSVSAEYNWSIGQNLGATLRMDARHTSGSLSDFRPNGVFTRRLDGYEIVNVRAGIEAEDDSWGAYLFVSNLFNELAITNASADAQSVGRTIVSSVPPRTIGLNLRTAF